jgi:acetyltransferase-like isoleucine patch superfamily enzyme
MKMSLQFIGDGGHAKNLLALIKIHHEVVERSEWKVLAFGALTCEKLEKRVTERPEGKYPNLIYPDCNYMIPRNNIKIGIGNQIMCGVVIQADVSIGDFNIINTGAIIEHDTVIGKGCHIAPGAVVLGDVKIGDFCFVGANAVVVQGSVVPPRTFINAGSVWKS